MARPNTNVREWAELIKIFVEIVAFIAAGYWAFSRFRVSEAPSLTERASLETGLTWVAMTDSSSCLAQFSVNLKNIGKSEFDVDTTRLRVWQIPAPSLEADLTFLDPQHYQSGRPIFERVFVGGATMLDDTVNSSITGTYAPDISMHDDFVFLVKRDPTALTVFRFDAWVSEAGKSRQGQYWSNYHWYWNCITESAD